jgi:hypothetical protein
LRRLFAKLFRRPSVARAATSAVELGKRYIAGEAASKHAAAALDYAETAKVRIANELSRRTLDDEVRLKNALADKAVWDARKARAEALAAESKLKDNASQDDDGWQR